VRTLLRTVTSALGALAAAFVAWINVQNHSPWPLVVMRAALAIAIVAAAGAVVGFVLMRTALRRHYESWLTRSRGRRARVER
jgi:ABC-type branched-subunit amino acid transport system permease subunit